MQQASASLLDLSQQWAAPAWFFRNVLMGFLLVRLFQMQAVTRYPALSAYLGLSILRAAALASIPLATTIYGLVFYATEPLLWLAYAGVCWEIYGLVFEKYQGLSMLSRRTLLLVLGLAFAISFFMASRYMSHSWDVFPVIRRAGMSSRAVVGTFLLCLVALIGFMLWFRMVVSRNVVIYVVAFSLLFVCFTFGSFLSASNGPKGTPISSFLMILSSDLVLTTWFLALRRSGEAVRSRLGPSPSPLLEQELLSTLDSLNRLAAAAAKKI
jgi:hypothetical protein